MRLFLFILLFSLPAYAQDFSDEIPTRQEFERDLAPAKKPSEYDAHASAKGDLDGDGVDEQVLIVQSAPNHPQQSILIFKGDELWKIGANHAIEDSDGMLDPHGIVGLNIQKGILEIAMGPWGASCTQKWRNEPAGLRLIGLTRMEIYRNCACGTIVDTNYVTGQSIMTSDHGPDGTQLSKEITRRTKIAPQTILWEDFNYKKYCG